MALELILIRHGLSEGNIGTSTDPDCALTDNGIQQARALGSRLASLDLSGFAGLVSPYRRTRHTAAEITRFTGMPFAVEERIREWGETTTINERHYPREPVEDVVARLKLFLREYDGRKLVVVSHAAPIAILTQLAWGEACTLQGEFWIEVGNCCMRWLRTTCTP